MSLDRRFDQAIDFLHGEREHRPGGGNAHHRVQQMPAHRDWQRSEPAEDVDEVLRDPNLFARLAQCGFFDRLRGTGARESYTGDCVNGEAVHPAYVLSECR